MNSFYDILWVEDEHEVKEYFSDKEAFRVDRQKYMLKLLEDLENEEIFSRYSCAILDINLKAKGFGYYDTIDDEEERSGTEELEAIKKILERNQIKIRPEHNLDQNDEEFKKNAGYYVYLYLVNRGMPPSRICILTANHGQNLNLTGAWKGNFETAGLQPPKPFDRSLAELGSRKKERSYFESWLDDETLTPAFRLRSCIIGMSFYAEKLLEDETLKVHMKNLYRIPLRLSEDKETASPEFISALWQILQIWESHEDSNSAYRMTLKTSRNWFAHRCLKKISLLTAAFLFGIGMRGLLGETIRKKIDSKSDDENINGYKCWERELFSLIEELDKKKERELLSLIEKLDKKIDMFGALVMKSCQEFFVRVKNSPEKFRIELTTEICTLIAQTIGQKKNNFEIYEEDLLRCFLHGIYTINWRGEGRPYDKPNYALGIVFDFDEERFKRLENSKETKYLNAVKNTMILAIYRK